MRAANSNKIQFRAAKVEENKNNVEGSRPQDVSHKSNNGLLDSKSKKTLAKTPSPDD